MRAIQKVIISVYLAVVATACLYVPKGVRISPNSNIISSFGFAWLWRPFIWYHNGEPIAKFSTIDIRAVIIELIAITAIFGILFVLTLRPKKVLPGS